MKKLSKKLMALLMVSAIGLSLAACGGANESADESSAESSVTSSAESESEETSSNSASESDTVDYSQYTIGFSQDANDIEWTQKMKDDVQAACDEYGINLTTTTAGNNGEKQVSNIEDLITLGVDVILVHTYHADVIANVVNEALAADIPVVVLASEISGVDPTCLITVDSNEAGATIANYVVEKYPDGAKIVQITGKEGSEVNKQRGEGFRSVIDADSNFEVLSELSGNYERSKALTVMEDQIRAYGDEIQVVYCHNDDMALGAIQAIEDAGYTANVDDGILVCSPADGIYEEVLNDIADGKMVSGLFPTFGQEGVDAAIDIINGKEVDKEIILPTDIITAETVDDYR